MKSFITIQPNRYTLDELLANIQKSTPRNSDPLKHTSVNHKNNKQNYFHLSSFTKHLSHRKQRSTEKCNVLRQCKMITNLPKLTKSNHHEYLRKGKSNLDEQIKQVMSKVRIKKNEMNKIEYKHKSCAKIFHEYIKNKECSNSKCSLFKIRCQFCKKKLDCFNREFEEFLRERKLWGRDFLYRSNNTNKASQNKQTSYRNISDQLKRQILAEISTVLNLLNQKISHIFQGNLSTKTEIWRKQMQKQKEIIKKHILEKIKLYKNNEKGAKFDEKQLKEILEDFSENVLGVLEKQNWSFFGKKLQIEKHQKEKLLQDRIERMQKDTVKHINECQEEEEEQQLDDQITPRVSIKIVERSTILKNENYRNYLSVPTSKKHVGKKCSILDQNQSDSEEDRTRIKTSVNFDQSINEKIKLSKLVKSTRIVRSYKVINTESYIQAVQNFILPHRAPKESHSHIHTPRTDLSSEKFNTTSFRKNFLDDQNSSFYLNKADLEQNSKKKKIKQGFDELSENEEEQVKNQTKKSYDLEKIIMQVQLPPKQKSMEEENYERNRTDERPKSFKKKYKRRYGFIEKKAQSQNEKEWRNLRKFIQKNKELIDQMNRNLSKKNKQLPIQNYDSLLTRQRKINYLEHQSPPNQKNQKLKSYLNFHRRGHRLIKSLEEAPEDIQLQISETQVKEKRISHQKAVQLNNKKSDIKLSDIRKQIYESLNSQPLMFYELSHKKHRPQKLSEVQHNFYLNEYEKNKIKFEEQIQIEQKRSNKTIQKKRGTPILTKEIRPKERDRDLIQIPF